MRDRQVCIDCGTLSPETETNYTLISSQFGWRLTRTRTPDGAFIVEWRCPGCWKEHKRLKAAAEEARFETHTSSAPPSDPGTPLTNRPLPSFPSRPPLGDEEPTLQRSSPLQRPRTPAMQRPATPAKAAPPAAPDAPIPPRLPRTPR